MLQEPFDCSACVASALPAGEMRGLYGIEDLVRHGVEKHAAAQPAARIVIREKRKRASDPDSEDSFCAAVPGEGSSDETDGSPTPVSDDTHSYIEFRLAPILDFKFGGDVDPALLGPNQFGGDAS